MPVAFADRLAQAVRRKRTPLVVGLDPRLEMLPAELVPAVPDDPHQVSAAYRRFCCQVIDVVAPLVPAVKPQVAFFEQWGPAGLEALARVIQHAQAAGLLVIVDAKRGDIGSTAVAYAQAYLGQQAPWPGDALTVNPYLGPDTLEPFISLAAEQGRGVFVLVKTSNRQSGAFQDLPAEVPLHEHVAAFVEQQAAQTAGTCGYGTVGAVVGATHPEQLTRLRKLMPHAWLLVPGLGAQGATAADVAAAFDPGGLGAVVNSSRGIIFAWHREAYAPLGSERWKEAVRQAARDTVEQLRRHTPAGAL